MAHLSDPQNLLAAHQASSETSLNPQQIHTLVSLLCQHGADSIGIFGSYAKGTAGPDSDLDVLVTFNQRQSLLTLARIKRLLSQQLGMEVDLLTEGAISPYLRQTIRDELQLVFP